jgi:hypothetical protein
LLFKLQAFYIAMSLEACHQEKDEEAGENGIDSSRTMSHLIFYQVHGP